MTPEKLAALLEYVRSDGRVCPMPKAWLKLFEMLPAKKPDYPAHDPSPPLILAAWSEPALPKIVRLEAHIRYAADHGVLDDVDRFLRSLPPEQWLTLDP